MLRSLGPERVALTGEPELKIIQLKSETLGIHHLLHVLAVKPQTTNLTL